MKCFVSKKRPATRMKTNKSSEKLKIINDELQYASSVFTFNELKADFNELMEDKGRLFLPVGVNRSKSSDDSCMSEDSEIGYRKSNFNFDDVKVNAGDLLNSDNVKDVWNYNDCCEFDEERLKEEEHILDYFDYDKYDDISLQLGFLSTKQIKDIHLNTRTYSKLYCNSKSEICELLIRQKLKEVKESAYKTSNVKLLKQMGESLDNLSDHKDINEKDILSNFSLKEILENGSIPVKRVIELMNKQKLILSLGLDRELYNKYFKGGFKDFANAGYGLKDLYELGYVDQVFDIIYSKGIKDNICVEDMFNTNDLILSYYEKPLEIGSFDYIYLKELKDMGYSYKYLNDKGIRLNDLYVFYKDEMTKEDIAKSKEDFGEFCKIFKQSKDKSLDKLKSGAEFFCIFENFEVRMNECLIMKQRIFKGEIDPIEGQKEIDKLLKTKPVTFSKASSMTYPEQRKFFKEEYRVNDRVLKRWGY